MGKSDPYLKNFYLGLLNENKFSSAGFFGQSQDNFLTKSILCDSKEYFDLSLDNWNINDEQYDINKMFDLIVCTRCCYFSKDPEMVLNNFKNILNPGGKILVDWGLGDHWRYDNYKVGWVRNGEHESFYEPENYLWSTVWHNSFESHPEVLKFKNLIKKFGYKNNLSEIIKEEVPAILDLEEYSKKNNNFSIKCSIMTLWPDSPQLYFGLVLEGL